MDDSEIAVYSGPTIDDVMRLSFQGILKAGEEIVPSRGPARELAGVVLKITNPLARLSRTESRARPFSCLGELFWYLSGSNKLSFIKYYIPQYKSDADGDEIHGGYGPRLLNWRNINQLRAVIDLLRRNPDSRRAVIQLYDATDLVGHYKDVPCTCSLQFMVRQGRLNLVTHMRSNDAYLGLPHDVFCFTMLQEIVARSLSAELGNYTHMVGSFHLYEEDVPAAKTFLNEGWQPTKGLMNKMPEGDPWPAIQSVLSAENAIRLQGTSVSRSLECLDGYWADIVRLLQFFRAVQKDGDADQAKRVRDRMVSSNYLHFMDNRIERLLRRVQRGK